MHVTKAFTLGGLIRDDESDRAFDNVSYIQCVLLRLIARSKFYSSLSMYTYPHSTINCDVVLEAHEKMEQAEDDKKKKLEHEKEKEARKLDRESLTAYKRWETDGKLYADGKPELKPDEAKAILHILPPRKGSNF